MANDTERVYRELRRSIVEGTPMRVWMFWIRDITGLIATVMRPAPPSTA